MNKMRNLTSLRLLKRKSVRGESTASKDNKEKEKKKEKKREKAMKRKKGEGTRSELMMPGGASPRAECDAKEAEDDRSFQRRQRGHTLPANAPRTLGTSN
jgi:hypothetical protein